MFWRVVSSPWSRPYCSEISPIRLNADGLRIPLGILIRIMNVPILGLSWYIPYHCKRTMSSSGSFSYEVSASRCHWPHNSVGNNSRLSFSTELRLRTKSQLGASRLGIVVVSRGDTGQL